MKTPSETVQAAQRLLAEREIVGLAKYGTTVDRTDLQAGDWLKHAIEEASDLLLYLIRLQQTMSVTALVKRLSDVGEPYHGPAIDPDRAAYLARWANAPEWAQWLAQDGDGWCFWFSGKPYQHELLGWCITPPEQNKTAGENLLGRFACEPRPTPAADPARAAYLKRWEGAPEWADDLSQSPSADCYWLERGHPYRLHHAGHNLLGSVRCEQRPEVRP